MIIEIKDMPNGASIKHLKIDIEFNDDCMINTITDAKSSISIDNSNIIQKSENKANISSIAPLESSETPAINIEKPFQDISNRAPKNEIDLEESF